MKNWEKTLKRLLVLGLSVAMLLGSVDLTGLTAFATENNENAQVVAQESSFEGEMEIITIEAMTSAPPIGFFSLEDGTVELKAGNYVKWIDRIDVPQNILDFYATLEEAVDNDGVDDFLIEDTYFNGDNKILVVDVEEVVEEGESYDDVSNDLVNRYTPFVYAALNAFDRDHPEVFWSNGQMSIGMLTGGRTDEFGVQYGTAKIYYVVQNSAQNTDMRHTAYDSEAKIKAAIAVRDTQVNTLCTAVAGKSDYEKVQYFNEWLTKNNMYNTSENLDTIDNDCRECITALKGAIGTVGPVCESYARAMQVLCNYEGIPCVLVDGANHMWNYIQMDGKWYGVDVTWNDPSLVGGYPDDSSPVSGVEREDYLLIGSETVVGGSTFITTHPVANSVMSTGVAFTNGPVLETSKYVPKTTIDVTSSTVTISVATGSVYSGTAKTPAVTVKNGETTLTENTHYTLTYENNVNAGTNTAKVTVKGIGDYSGTKTVNFSIDAAAASTALTAANTSQEITFGDGTFTEPTFKGLANEAVTGTLTYAIGGESNLTVAQAKEKLALEGKGTTPSLEYTFTPNNTNYTGTKAGTISFTVKEASLASAIVTLLGIPEGGYVYDNTAKKPSVSVVLNGKSLVETTDYTVAYSDNINAGTDTAKVTITGANNYSGTAEKKFSIFATEAITVDVTATQKILLGVGDFKEPAFKGVADEIISGTLTYSVDSQSDLTYAQAKAKLAELENGTSKTMGYKFVPTNANYTGQKSGNISVTVEDIKFYVGAELVAGDNAYTLKASPIYGDTWADIVTIKDTLKAVCGENEDLAAANFKLNVTGSPTVGNNEFKILYNGTLGGKTYTDVVVCTGTVDIAKKNMSEVTVSITTPTDEIVYDKTAKTPQILVKDGEKTLVLDTDYTVNYTNDVNAGTDTAVVTVTGKGNYTGTKTANFSIKKASSDVTTVTVATNQDILLGEGEFVEPVFKGIQNEEITASITYSYDGATTYDAVKNKLKALDEGATADIGYTITPAADGNYEGTKIGTISIKVVDIEFKIGGVKATLSNTVEIADEAVYGMTWEELISVKSGLSASRGVETDNTASHFTLNVTGTPSVGTKNFAVVYNGTLGGKEYTDAIVCSGTVTISAKSLEPATYTLTVPERGYTYSAEECRPDTVVKLDDVTLVKDTDYTVSYTNNMNAGTDTATVTITGKGNYSGTKSAKFSIAKKQITAVVEADKEYDGTNAADVIVTVNAGDLCASDVVTITGSTGTYANKAAADEIAVTVTLGTISGQGSENYDVKLPDSVTGKITKKTIKLQATDMSKNYGEADPELKYTFTDGTALISGDILSGSIERAAGDNAGTYSIGQGTLANPNYNIIFTDGTFTVNAVSYTENVTTLQNALSADVFFKEPLFKGVDNADVSGILTYGYDGENGLTYAGLIEKLNTLPGDSTAVVDYKFVPTANGNYTGEKAGTITIKIGDILFMVGSDSADADNADADNAVTLTADATYGMTWAELVKINSGIKAVRGENIDSDVSHFTLNVTGTPNAGNNQAFTILYNGTVGGQTYVDKEVCSGTINVAKKTITVDVGTYKVSKVYDKTVTAGTKSGALEIEGILSTDTAVVVNDSFGDYSNANVKGQDTIPVELTLGGAGSDNYKLEKTTLQVPCEITPMSVTPVITITGTYTYTGSAIIPTFTITANGDNLTATDYDVAYDSNVNVGTATAKFTAKENGNYVWSGSVDKTFEIGKGTYAGTKTFTVSGVYGTETAVDLTTLLPEDAAIGISLGSITKADPDNVFESVSLEGTVLTYTLVAETDLIGKSGEVTIPVTDSTNYVAYEIEVTIECTDKLQQNISFVATTMTKTVGDAPFVFAVYGAATGSTVTYTSSDSSVATVDNTGKVTILKEGQVEIKAIASSTDKAQEATAKYTLTINKKPVVTQTPSVTPPEQEPLSVQETSQTPTVIPGGIDDDELPQIKDNDGQSGWQAIRQEILTTKKGETVVVEMNGTTDVPKEIFKAIAGKDITLVLEMSEDISWTMNGLDVPDTGLNRLDLGVDTKRHSIPEKLIEEITGEKEFRTISINHNGEFGMKAILSMELGSRHEGLFGNLFYHNVKAGTMDFVSASRIDATGRVSWPFEHASEYVVVISDTVMDGSEVTDTESTTDITDNNTSETVEADTTDDAKDESAPATAQPKAEGGSSIWIIIVIVVIAAIAFASILIVLGKRKEK